jgi:ATP-dependent Zn protease
MTQLETMKEFVLTLRKELKEERTTNGNKFKNDEYENKYEYWNRFNELNGKSEALKEVQKFVMYLINKERYEGFTTSNEDLEYIPNDDEHIPPIDIDNWNIQ